MCVWQQLRYCAVIVYLVHNVLLIKTDVIKHYTHDPSDGQPSKSCAIEQALTYAIA